MTDRQRDSRITPTGRMRKFCSADFLYSRPAFCTGRAFRAKPLQPLDGSAPKQLTDYKQGRIYRREWTRDGKQVAIVRGESTNDVVMITDFK